MRRRFPRIVHGVRRRADDVAEDVGRQHAALLQHHAQLLAHGADVERRQVLAVVGDRAALRPLEAEQQAQQGRLAAARTSRRTRPSVRA